MEYPRREIWYCIFRAIKKIKGGRYGIVYLIEEIQTKRKYAAKVLISYCFIETYYSEIWYFINDSITY